MTVDHYAAGLDGVAPQRRDVVGAPRVGGEPAPAPPVATDVYRAIFASSPEAILLADTSGRYVDANDSALALLGYEREELLSLTIRDTAALGPSWAVAEFERFQRDGRWEGDAEVRTRTGALVPLAVRAVILPGPDAPLYVAFLRDRREQRDSDLSRARLAAIVRSSADAIVGETLDGIITDWNPAAERLYGYTAEEAIGRPLSLLASPDRKVEIEGLLGRVVSGESIEHLETVRRTKRGQLVPVALTLSPVRDERGDVVAASAIVRDISVQKESARALALSEARYRALVDYLPAVVYTEVLTTVDTLTYVSPFVETLLGYAPEEFYADRGLWTRCIHPEDRERIWAAAERMMATGERFTEEYRLLGRDGSLRWVRDIAVPLRDETGKIFCSQGVVMDVTEGKQTERALEASEARFRAAFENAPIGMVLTGISGRPFQVNRAMCAVLGYTAEELLARTVWDYTHPDDVPSNQAIMRQALAGEIDGYALEKRYLRKDGRTIWVSLSASLVSDEDGAPLYFIAQIQDITARKAAEDELAATHQNTRQVLDRISDGFYALDTDWRFTYVNDEAERILERPRQELLGRTIWEAFPPVAETVLYEIYHQALSDGRPTTTELFYPPLAAWLEVRAYPSRNGLSVFFRDITERRRLEEELRASEARYRTLVEQIPAVVYVLAADENQSPLYFNPYVENVIGIKPEAAGTLKGHWLEVVHPDDLERVMAEEARTAQAGLHFSAEYRHRRNDGSYVWVHDECMPIRDDAGNIVAWQGVMFDISERMQAEEARARLAAIVESAEDAVVSRTLDGIITSWNDGAERLYGYSAAEMIGRSFTVLLPEDQLPASHMDITESGAQSAQFETRRRRKDGQLIDVAISLSPIRDARGALVGVSTITRDIGARKRMEEDLRAALDAAQAAQRATTQFLGMMSHELRTPMQAVLGYADLLLAGDERSLSLEQREDVRYIKHGATRMMRLVEQMLSLSRLEAGRLEVNLERVDLATVCEQVRQEIAPLAAAKRLALVIALPPELPPVVADVVYLHRILLNLVENAVKFTERGEVRVGACVTAEGTEIAVSDTGIGIASKALPHIFEEFWQVDGGLTRRYGGAGLGLAITRKLVELHGGRLSVTSQLAFGSTFTVHLPGHTVPSPDHPGEAAPTRQSIT